MKKTVIIDGNNLMHKAYGSHNNHNALISTVNNLLGNKYKLIFYFDGKNDIKLNNVIFSGNKTADELIKNYIEMNKNPKHLLIVSSDNEIKSFAKVCGCEVKTSSEFWNEINKGHITKGKNINQNFIYDKNEKPEGISKKDLENFRKLFS